MVIHCLNKWGMKRAEPNNKEVESNMWAYIAKHGNKKQLQHKPMKCTGAPKFDRRSDYRPMSYSQKGTVADITEIRHRESHPMLGWRLSVSVARRLARAWAEWTPATIGEVQKCVQSIAAGVPLEGPQARLGTTAQERRACELHEKL